MARNWHPASLNKIRKCLDSDRAISSKTRCLAVWFTMPGKTQYSTALRIIVLFDFAVGCLNSLGPETKKILPYNNFLYYSQHNENLIKKNSHNAKIFTEKFIACIKLLGYKYQLMLPSHISTH